MNRPNPFGPHHRRDDREPMLMDISTAKPSNDVNWEAIIAKTQRGKMDPSQKAYDTSKYLAQVREEDPWPEAAQAKSFPMILSNCRIREAAPVDLSGTVTVLCDVESAGPIAEADRTLKLELRVIYRESTKDSDELFGQPEFVTLEPIAFQTVQATFSVEGLADSRMDPGTELFLHAQAIHTQKKLTARAKPVATIAGPTRASRLRLSGRLFDHDKCFLLPGALPALRKIIAQHQKRPTGPLVIVSHPGPDAPDSALALARAKALASILTNRWDEWLPWFAPEKPAASRWGWREAQVILKHLKVYEGQCSGVEDEPSHQALKAFQKSVTEKGEIAPSVSGKLDSATRKELLRAYFGQEKTTLAKALVPQVCVCEGAAPKPPESKDVLAEAHLEILFFEPRLDPKPRGERVRRGEKTYSTWLDRVDATEDFEVHGLHIQVVDDNDAGIPGAKVLLEGPERIETKTDDHGWITVDGLSRGTYTVRVTSDVADEDEDVVCELEVVVPTPRAVDHEVKTPTPVATASEPAPLASSLAEPSHLAPTSTPTAAPSASAAPAPASAPAATPAEAPVEAAPPKPKGIDIPLFESHFHDNHHMPNLVDDDFLEVLAGLADYHKKNGSCPLELHPEIGEDNRELNAKRLAVAECILHGDEAAWKEFTKDATTRDVQTFLKYFASKGWYCDPGKVDGVEGPKTRMAISKFQYSHNEVASNYLQVDGKCGPKTWNAILHTLARIIQPR
ncbi:MAG: peptidoglycan-binding protein [Fibrobacteres bacterium]|nr:peptidoglycan-binding protein [Fibrobacterota bacterium]